MIFERRVSTFYIRLPRCLASRPLPPLPRGIGWTPGSGIPGTGPGIKGAPIGFRRIIRGGTFPGSAGLGDQVIGTGLLTGMRLSPRPRDGGAPGDEPRLRMKAVSSN